MRLRALSGPLLAACLAVSTSAVRGAEPDAGEALTPPDAIATRHVPPISRAVEDDLLPYQNSRSAQLSDWHPSERRMLISTRFAETNQVHEVSQPLGARRQLTFFDEPVSGGLYRPGDPEQLVFSYNQGGAENFQLYLLDRRSGRPRRFTDGVHRHQGARWSRGGKLLAYTSNARNGRDFDLYVADPAVAGSARRVAELSGSWAALAWSPDDRRLLVAEFLSANESYLYELDLGSGALQEITPRRGQPPASYGGGRWSPDGRFIYTTTDRDGEFRQLVRWDRVARTWTPLSGGIPWDVEGFDLSDDGRLLAFFTNEDGTSKLHILDLEAGREAPAPELPAGVASDPEFRPGSHEVGFELSWARSPSDVYSYDVGARRLERWTAGETGGLDAESFALPDLVRFPTFDEVGGERRTLSAFVYRPAAERHPRPLPVVISIHGGPEGQSRPNYKGWVNYLIDELGAAVVYPNVRGSTGYGKSFLKLDNGRLREDSVRDVGALLDWVSTQPDLDARRVMVSGGSYGGYMVLASLVMHGDRLCCGSETVGISNFVTFLEATSGYRQDLRRVEYGDERDPEMRRFLESIAPLNHVDRIKRPLLVGQGANDPRVPLAESEQIVAALEGKGVPVWYVVGKNEGHGFAKKENADYLQAVSVEFLRRFLLGRPSAAAP
jgi:dipeptidyl aminopeptidase/acylaminoacyl peptidase